MNSCFRCPLGLVGGLRYPISGVWRAGQNGQRAASTSPAFSRTGAIIDPVRTFNRIPARERGADRVAGFVKHEHAVPGKEVFQEPDARAVASFFIPAVAGDHVPVLLLLIRDRIMHGPEDPLLPGKAYPLVCPEQVPGNLPGQMVTIFRREVLDFRRKVPFHPLDVSWSMCKYEACDLLAELPRVFASLRSRHCCVIASQEWGASGTSGFLKNGIHGSRVFSRIL